MHATGVPTWSVITGLSLSEPCPSLSSYIFFAVMMAPWLLVAFASVGFAARAIRRVRCALPQGRAACLDPPSELEKR
jgi:hypothetical protein